MKSPSGAAGVVAIILAISVGVSVNVITAAICFAALTRLGVDPDSGISENGTQLLTAAFSGMIGALSAYMGFTLGKKTNGKPEPPEPLDGPPDE